MARILAVLPSPISITLRNAQVRRISWVRGVRPVWERHEWPPHDAAPGRPPSCGVKFAGHRWHPCSDVKRAPLRRPWSLRIAGPSLDLGLAEFDVLLGDRIVFLLDDLVRHRARVLLGHVIEPGVGAR